MKFIRLNFMIAASIGFLMGPVSARYVQMNTNNDKHLAHAAELIKAFETEREPEHLREASIELENVDLRRVYDKKLRSKQRLQCLELWLTIIQTIDKNIDAAFDPNDVPTLNVMPPPLKNGTQLWPGADPALIDDPKAREEYQKAIKANREKQERVLIQSQLRELNETIPDGAVKFINRYYPDAERSEPRDAIKKIIESESRRELLLRSIEPQK